MRQRNRVLPWEIRRAASCPETLALLCFLHLRAPPRDRAHQAQTGEEQRIGFRLGNARHAVRLAGMEKKILTLYAKWMTTRDVESAPMDLSRFCILSRLLETSNPLARTIALFFTIYYRRLCIHPGFAT
jgi:hypothetical protein